MPYNGSGTYAAAASTWNPAVTNTAINSTDWIALLADLTTALSTCLLKDGQQTPTANIPMGGFKFTGLAAGSATGNSLRYEQLFTSGTVTLLGAFSIPTTLGVTGTSTLAAVNAGAGSFTTLSASGTSTLATVNTSGDVTINKATPLLTVDGTGTTSSFVRLSRGGVSKWDIVNAGTTSDQFQLTDTAVVLMTMARTTGNTVFTGSVTVGGTLTGPSTMLSPITASLGADVALNNTGTYFDGPTIAQGTSGTWFVSGTATITDNNGAANYDIKLHDGTSVIASAGSRTDVIAATASISLSGYISSPAGNLRISVKDKSSTGGKILFNSTGNSKDSTISAIRIA